MEAGLFDNIKVGFVIQARMQSTRLPGKVLLPLPFPNGSSLLGRIISQLREISKSSSIIVATSTNPENDILEKFCLEEGIFCYRGSEEKVLSRFEAIQRKFEFDHIFRLTSDNPFIDLPSLKKVFHWHLNQNNDYSSTKNLPIGMNFEVFRGESLIKSLFYAGSDFDQEHVTPALKRESHFKSECLDIGYKYENIRVTVDSPADFLTVNILFSIADSTGLQGLGLIDYVKENYPWILEGNKGVFQKNRTLNLREEILEAKIILEELSFQNAASLLLKNL
ncbi:cytidylyltransferase domain-containing protein [Shivajiella indica]|uniref:Cytidylyltransferase domain-containing protein n=1 Tax=Shivajiella indica TaxID=872115 RepID=A0ABW5B8L3_9BACT